MSTHNICFGRKRRKYQYFLVGKSALSGVIVGVYAQRYFLMENNIFPEILQHI